MEQTSGYRSSSCIEQNSGKCREVVQPEAPSDVRLEARKFIVLHILPKSAEGVTDRKKSYLS